MTTYMGNVGNLMQHWTLCELLRIANKHTKELSFIDAHAMAPYATHTPLCVVEDARFKSVRKGLPSKSVYEQVWYRYEQAWHRYEQAWHHLASNGGYPNSASFVRKVWKGDFSLLLSETECSTIMELMPWLKCVQKLERCKKVDLYPGDWRIRFAQGLPSVAEVGLSDKALTLVSFDPDICSSHWRYRNIRKREKKNLYPDDIELALRAMNGLEGGILIQLSTYSANGNNPQWAVIASIGPIMKANHFKLRAEVRVNGNMMSLVYARNVPWAAELANLPGRFTNWLAEI